MSVRLSLRAGWSVPRCHLMREGSFRGPCACCHSRLCLFFSSSNPSQGPPSPDRNCPFSPRPPRSSPHYLYTHQPVAARSLGPRTARRERASKATFGDRMAPRNMHLAPAAGSRTSIRTSSPRLRVLIAQNGTAGATVCLIEMIHTSQHATGTLGHCTAFTFCLQLPLTQISTNLTGRSRRQPRSCLRDSQTPSNLFIREQSFPPSTGSAHASEIHMVRVHPPSDRSMTMSIALTSIARASQLGRIAARRTGNKCIERVECGRGSPEEFAWTLNSSKHSAEHSPTPLAPGLT
ncbi:hypothetical protein V8D89_010392 [Ganoderma adspersum]